MQQLMVYVPEWLPSWVPVVLLLPTLLWALSFLFMPFSVFGVKSRLEAIEARLDEIQNELRNVSARPIVSGAGPDFDEVYAAQLAEPRVSDRILSRPPIPPARHELYNTNNQDSVAEPPFEDRAPPPPNARPPRRMDPGARPLRAEPRLDWRR